MSKKINKFNFSSVYSDSMGEIAFLSLKPELTYRKLNLLIFLLIWWNLIF